MNPDQIRELARALQEQYDLLGPGSRWTAPLPPQALATAHHWGAELVALKPLTRHARNGEADPLVQEVLGVQFAAVRMREAADEDEGLQALQGYLLRLPKQKGKRADWDDPKDGGGHPVTRIKETFKKATEQIEAVVDEHRTAALSELLVHLAAFTHAFAAERKVQGAATFHDLLVWARDLLRDRPDVRRAAAKRYQCIFVDEFQDTDPLQAELVCFLVADPDQTEERDWHKLRLKRGKLCLVGDPKQSIYRFRRADIAIYDALYARTGDGAEKVVLRQTRRSVAPVVDWVNHHFGSEMQHAPGVQASYEPLVPRPALDGLAFDEAGCGVHQIGGPMPGKSPERWAQEADEVARLAHHIVDQGWQVTERGGDGWRARPVAYGDICVLLPTRTNLRRLERAFERHDVPYRVESGSLVLQTQEVRDLLTCLRAIDDPSDQVALVAALRSPAYACSDADLLEWVEAGGQMTRACSARLQKRSSSSSASAAWRCRHSASRVRARRGDGCGTWPRRRAASRRSGRPLCAPCWTGWSRSSTPSITTPRAPYQRATTRPYG
jgi:ATP-dependent exoDNAse (exonuclease V) beta subunit